MWHEGNSVPAAKHVTPLCFSSSVHLSKVPSVQVLTWACVPGPHAGSCPAAWQVPSLVHAPRIFGTAAMNIHIYSRAHEGAFNFELHIALVLFSLTFITSTSTFRWTAVRIFFSRNNYSSFRTNIVLTNGWALRSICSESFSDTIIGFFTSIGLGSALA